MSDTKFNPLLIDNEPDTASEADPLIKDALQKRNAAMFDISKQLAGVPYAGSGTKAELIELEENMRDLLETGLHGYKFIEGFLLSMGYGLNKIRDAFVKLTGVEPQVYMDAQPYLNTPGTIPGINYGWGESKDKEYDYYFIMPYDAAWACFGQKGDLVREVIKKYATLDEARETLVKKVKEVQMFDKVIDPKKLKERNFQSLESENFPIGTKPAALQTYLRSIKSFAQPTEIRAHLEQAAADGQLTPTDFQKLAREFGLLKSADEYTDLEKAVFKTPIEDELEEKTPQQFFDKVKPNLTAPVAGDTVESVISYMDTLKQGLSEFDLAVRSFKYVTQEQSSLIEKSPGEGPQKPEEFFNSTGIISVLLDISDKTLPVTSRTKPGLAVFSIAYGQVVTSGNFKGDDNNLYSLSEEGFEQYFVPERTQSEK